MGENTACPRNKGGCSGSGRRMHAELFELEFGRRPVLLRTGGGVWSRHWFSSGALGKLLTVTIFFKDLFCLLFLAELASVHAFLLREWGHLLRASASHCSRFLAAERGPWGTWASPEVAAHGLSLLHGT